MDTKYYFMGILILIGYLGCETRTIELKNSLPDKIIELVLCITNSPTSMTFFELSKEIPLETKPGCYIVEIEKVMVYDTFLVITDSKDPLPFVFNHQGKFLYKISHHGKGPGEVYDNLFTSLKDSILSVLSYPQRVIYQYSVHNQLLKTIDINLDSFFYTEAYFIDPEYYMIHFGYNPHLAILGLFEPKTKKLDKLWPTGPEERDIIDPKQYRVTNLVQYNIQDKIFLCKSNDYKVHFWKKGAYQGYYTNKYYNYNFFHIDKQFDKKEFEIKFKREWIYKDEVINLFLLNNKYLFGELTYNDENKSNDGYIIWKECFDIIDMEQNIIYSHIDNRILNIVGVSENEVISTSLPLKDHGVSSVDKNWGKEVNPTLRFYRFDPEKLEGN